MEPDAPVKRQRSDDDVHSPPKRRALQSISTNMGTGSPPSFLQSSAPLPPIIPSLSQIVSSPFRSTPIRVDVRPFHVHGLEMVLSTDAVRENVKKIAELLFAYCGFSIRSFTFPELYFNSNDPVIETLSESRTVRKTQCGFYYIDGNVKTVIAIDKIGDMYIDPCGKRFSLNGGGETYL